MNIFAARKPRINPARKSPRANRPFGEGVFTQRDRTVKTAPYSAADAAFWAEFSNRGTVFYDVLIPAPKPISGGSPEPDWDAMYRESRLQSRLDRGLCL